MTISFLGKSGVGDPTIALLSGLESVLSVNINNTGATDRSVETLCSLRGLQVLKLGGTRITNVGMKSIGKISTLKNLTLPAGIDEQGLVEVAKLDNLVHLNAKGVKLGERGMALIASMEKLRTLDLSASDLTNKDLIHLRSLAELAFLNISNTRIGDDSVQYLRKLKQLAQLICRETDLTPGGQRAVQSYLPQTELSFQTPPNRRQYLRKLRKQMKAARKSRVDSEQAEKKQNQKKKLDKSPKAKT